MITHGTQTKGALRPMTFFVKTCWMESLVEWNQKFGIRNDFRNVVEDTLMMKKFNVRENDLVRDWTELNAPSVWVKCKFQRKEIVCGRPPRRLEHDWRDTCLELSVVESVAPLRWNDQTFWRRWSHHHLGRKSYRHFSISRLSRTWNTCFSCHSHLFWIIIFLQKK